MSGGELKFSKLLSGAADPSYEMQMGFNEIIFSRNGYQRSKIRFYGGANYTTGGVELRGLADGSDTKGGYANVYYDSAEIGINAGNGTDNTMIRAYRSSRDYCYTSISSAHGSGDSIYVSTLDVLPEQINLSTGTLTINGNIAQSGSFRDRSNNEITVQNGIIISGL